MGTFEKTVNFFSGVAENASQFDSADGSQRAEIIIGFDFGTSSTKVIVRPFNFPDDPVFIVPFGKLSDVSLSYLLPTCLFVSADGDCSLSSDDNSDSHLAAIKVALMKDPDSFIEAIGGISCDVPAKFIAVAYIALVLRYVRCWFLREQKVDFGNFLIAWSFNLGIPAAKLDHPPYQDKIFEIVGKVAWLVSLESGTINIESIKKIFQKVESKEDYSLDINFRVIPEIVAEVHGYAESDFRREVLHLLIDAGATTLDINGFMLGRSEFGNKYSIYLADVKNYGAMTLHNDRIVKVEEILGKKLENLSMANTLQLVPDSLDYYLPSDIDEELGVKIISILKDVDYNFRTQKTFWNYISKMLYLLRNGRNPYFRPWPEVQALQKELPVILGGGASVMSLYRDIVNKDIDGWLKKNVSPDFRVRLVPLPVPESLKGQIDETSYYRLAVAWGLSFPDYSIDNYSLPSEIEIDRKPSYRDNSDNFIDSSQV